MFERSVLLPNSADDGLPSSRAVDVGFLIASLALDLACLAALAGIAGIAAWMMG